MKRIALILFVAALTACANVQVTPLNPPGTTPAPRGPSEVTVFMTKAPDRPYDEAYIIRSDAGNSDDALNAMRKKAGELGCDGLIISGSADRVVSTPDGRGNSSVSMREGFIGSCIIYRAQPMPPPAAPKVEEPKPVIGTLRGAAAPAEPEQPPEPGPDPGEPAQPAPEPPEQPEQP